MTAEETARRDWNLPLDRAATRLFMSSKPHEKRRRERQRFLSAGRHARAIVSQGPCRTPRYAEFRGVRVSA